MERNGGSRLSRVSMMNPPRCVLGADMTVGRTRQAIASPDLPSISGLSPLAGASSILGVRIFDVGQGDSIAIMADVGGTAEVVLQLDYGGRERNPFKRNSDVDVRMPVVSNKLLMLTHWDEDHWSSAPKGSSAKNADWLVPRQVTSPRAVRFSATLQKIHCIPESLVGRNVDDGIDRHANNRQ